MSKLRFGILDYINCLRATYALESGSLGTGQLEIIKGSPSQLNGLMSSGELDVSLVSTAEFLNRRHLYQRLGQHSLWCDGFVESVTLFSPLSQTELATSRYDLAVTSQSATSVALLQILCPGCQTVPFTDSSELREELLGEGGCQGMLLIGDDALQAPEWTSTLQSHDLSQWWTEQTSLPMTFAVWVAREGLEQERLDQANELLSESLAWGASHLDSVLAEAQARSGLDEDRIRTYLERIQFAPNIKAAEGLLEFGGRVALNSLLGRPPRVLQTV